MSVTRKSFLTERMNYGTAITKKIKGNQHPSRHVKPTFASTKCPGQMDELNCLIYKYLETTNCLKPVRPKLACDVTFKSTPSYS